VQKVRGEAKIIEAKLKISVVVFLSEKDEKYRQTVSYREAAIVEFQ